MAFCVVLVAALAAAPLASAAPPKATADFSVQPPSPLTNEIATFNGSSSSTNRPDDPITSWEWDFNAGAVFQADAAGAVVARAFTEPGPHRVVLRVRSARGLVATKETSVTVRNRPAVASFTYSPAFPDTGQTVTFTSTSFDPEGSGVTLAWDLDADGKLDDGNARTVTRRYASGGTYAVRLRATDSSGAFSESIQNLVVGNRPPVASFVFTPAVAVPGDVVSFISISSDPDGPVGSHAWDLDGDGQFDDATGTIASRAFPTEGVYTVSLMVTDGEGLESVASQKVTVSFSAASSRSGALRLLSPFPVVRAVGTVRRNGIKLRRLIVTAPSGSRVLVTCKGARCPVHKQSRATSAGRPQAIAARSLRLRRFEHRLLRPGIVIRIYITKSGMIGKYTRFKVRRARPPARLDRCLVPGVKKPVRCPS